MIDNIVMSAAMAYADLETNHEIVPPKPALLGTALLDSIGPPPAALGQSPQVLFQHALRSVPGSSFEATLFG